MNALENKKVIFGIIVFLLIITIGSLGTAFYFYNENKNNACFETCESDCVNESDNYNKWYVEVKGAVKKPGVFEVKENNIINEVIQMAGGFNKNAYTNNINLSKKVSDELVIYVYTKTEYQKATSASKTQVKTEDIINNGLSNNVVDNNPVDSSNNRKININTASVEELSKLPGLGDKKAQAIIEYRNSNGNFKTPEDITNVSGIGTATYEKFKDLIIV